MVEPRIDYPYFCLISEQVFRQDPKLEFILKLMCLVVVNKVPQDVQTCFNQG